VGTTHDLDNQTILITAGGTREPIDTVRFLGNRSSGKMGHALAEAAASRGARVILVTASNLPAAGCEIIRVATTDEMLEAVLVRLPEATIVIKAAAVADFRPTKVATGKLRRGNSLTLQLEPTPDILAAVVANRSPGTIVVGFAAEIEDILANGRAKLQRKSLDALFVNDVSNSANGFDSDYNAGYWLTATETVSLAQTTKHELAHRILDMVLSLKPVPA
jgi:phosphopantothenoylcysteine decarboxylase/phosphopantothenate--cysteine ligase